MTHLEMLHSPVLLAVWNDIAIYHYHFPALTPPSFFLSFLTPCSPHPSTLSLCLLFLSFFSVFVVLHLCHRNMNTHTHTYTYTDIYILYIIFFVLFFNLIYKVGTLSLQFTAESQTLLLCSRFSINHYRINIPLEKIKKCLLAVYKCWYVLKNFQI